MNSSIANCDSNDAWASVEITNGISPFQIAWNDAGMQTADTAVNLNSGWYTVVVQDSAQCLAMDSVFVTQDSSLAMPDEIFGPDTICISSIENYFINYAGNADSFHWVALILAL